MRIACSTLLMASMIGVSWATGGADDDVNYLRAQFKILQSLPPARQQQLRDLDRDLHALDAAAQDRLYKVMANYNYWLARLPADERRRIIEAATPDERLSLIQKVKDREWIETLPKAYRDKYANAEKGDRGRLLVMWREEQHERREEWQFVVRNWEDIKDERTPLAPPLEVRKQLDAYSLNLESQMLPSDREKLRKARDNMQEERGMFQYFRALLELSDRYVLLPGPLDGPRHFDALPKADRDALEKADKLFFKKKNIPKELQGPQGRWPDFAIAVTDYAKQHGIVLPEPLGPNNKAAMPAEVRLFIDEKLEPVLQKTDPVDLARLHKAERKWPDYPRTVMELAKQHKLVVPGWMIPGKADLWERYRTKPKK